MPEIRSALELGIARQGATLSDYRTPNGDRGAMQDEFEAYGRDGEPCSRCGTAMEKTRAGGGGRWCRPYRQRRRRGRGGGCPPEGAGAL